MSSILSLFPIENVFICLKEIFSEVGCGIIYIDKLGRGVLPERVAGISVDVGRRIHARRSPDGATATA